MSDIDDLRRRVSEAEQRFGYVNEECSQYSERVVALIKTLEERLRAQRSINERHAAEVSALESKLAAKQEEVERKSRDNEQLRGMLHSLLQAIESGGRHSVTEAMRELDRKISGLVGGTDDLPAASIPTAEPAGEARPADLGDDPWPEAAGGDFEAETAAFETPTGESFDRPETAVKSLGLTSSAFEDVEPETLVAEALADDSAEIPSGPDEAQSPIAASADDAASPRAGETEPDPAPESSGSLSDIMARVSRLVREADRAEAPKPYREDPPADPPSGSTPAPGKSQFPLRRSIG